MDSKSISRRRELEKKKLTDPEVREYLQMLFDEDEEDQAELQEAVSEPYDNDYEMDIRVDEDEPEAPMDVDELVAAGPLPEVEEVFHSKSGMLCDIVEISVWMKKYYSI